MPSRGKVKYRKQWEKFAEYLKTNNRPQSFEEAYAVVCDKVSGLYRSEAEAMWYNIKSINPESIVEVGRNLGGSQFLFCCAATELKSFLSVDIELFELTDSALEIWGSKQGIYVANVIHDSTTFEPADEMWDLVFIDGGHSGPIVKADIEVWKDHCKYIAFHDYADRGSKNKHKRVFKDVIAEISNAADKYGWKPFGVRGRSDITFETKYANNKDTS